MEKLRISLYQRHITKGCRKNPSNCPVARAVREAMPEHLSDWKIHVSNLQLWITDHNNTNTYKAIFPDSVIEAIANFDETGNMKPMEFDVGLALVSCDSKKILLEV
jgi:hypothetical protein|tara:strand:- start:394 stop:711 length:318 start_codon:yes stop_codon:yes gene_type:complete